MQNDSTVLIGPPGNECPGEECPVEIPAATEVPEKGKNTMPGMMAEKMNVSADALAAHPVIGSLFEVNRSKGSTFEWICGDMRENGFDATYPLIVCPVPDEAGKYYIVDGYTRYQAALENKIAELPVLCTSFNSIDAMLDHAGKSQFIKRGHNDAVILQYVIKTKELEAEKALKRKGRRSDLAVTSGQACPEVAGRASEVIARKINCATTTIKHAIAISADEGLREKVLAGTLSINKAYNMLSTMKKAVQPGKTNPEGDIDIDSHDAESAYQEAVKNGVAPKPMEEADDDEEDIALSFPVSTRVMRKILALVKDDAIDNLKAIAREVHPGDLSKLIVERIEHSHIAA